MIVDRNEMFGGWFKAFALQGQTFDYVFEDGTVLLSNFSISQPSAGSSANALIRFC